MKLHTYRYGEGGGLPGLRVGVTRFLPRGVRKSDFAAGGYFDLWLPILAPSRELVGAFQRGELSFAKFAARYRAEMKRPEPRQVIALTAAVAREQRINLGCYCADETRCHRILLKDLILAAAPGENTARGYSSPACSMPEIED